MLKSGWIQKAFGAVLLVGATAFVSCSTNRPNEFSETDRLEVEKLDQDYAAAWASADAEKNVMELFVPDAIMMPHHGDEPVKGHKAIREFFWPAGSGPTQILEFTRTAIDIGGSGDLGYAAGRFRLQFAFEQKGEMHTYRNEGNYLLLAERQKQGTWQIKRLIWNDPVARED